MAVELNNKNIRNRQGKPFNKMSVKQMIDRLEEQDIFIKRTA